MKIITIGILFATIFILISNLPAIYSKEISTGFENDINHSDQVIFRDDFDNENDIWVHWNEGCGSHYIEEGNCRLSIWYGDQYHYHNSEIWTNDSISFLYNNFKAGISVDKTTKGSKGWGFYNRNYCDDKMSYAWFMYNRFSSLGLFPTNGFFAICWNGDRDWSIKRIRNIDLSEYHIYEIKWAEDCVGFFIDGKSVAHFTRGIPTNELKVDVWIDNMNFFPPFFAYMLRIRLPNSINIDFIEVTE